MKKFTLVFMLLFSSIVLADYTLEDGDFIIIPTEDVGKVLYYCHKMDSTFDVNSVVMGKKLSFDNHKVVMDINGEETVLKCRRSQDYKEEMRRNSKRTCSTSSYHTRVLNSKRYIVEGVEFSDEKKAIIYMNELDGKGVCEAETYLRF